MKGVDLAVKVGVICYSATGNVYGLARATEEGAKEAGAEARLRKVRELASEEAIKSNQGWYDHTLVTEDVPEASIEELEWADAYLFGTPTRCGNVSAQPKQFWTRPAECGSRASSPKGRQQLQQRAEPARQESTIISMYNVFMRWGSIVVPPGYTDPVLFEAGGNPCGTSSTDGGENGQASRNSPPPATRGGAWPRRPPSSPARGCRLVA